MGISNDNTDNNNNNNTSSVEKVYAIDITRSVLLIVRSPTDGEQFLLAIFPIVALLLTSLCGSTQESDWLWRQQQSWQQEIGA